MLERKVKQAVKERLDELGAYYFMPVQAGLGTVSLDFLVCHEGRFVGIETKRPGGKPTILQTMTMERIRKAGGTVLLIDSLEKAANITGKEG